MFRVIGLLAAFALLAGGYAVWPLYGFFAHSGDAPLPFWGWERMPEGGKGLSKTSGNEWITVGEAALDKLDAHRRNIGAPAMSAAVAVGGEVVWAGATGWADLGDEAPATPDTQFRIGSTSKAVTASALARMVDQGKIDLDAPIGTYLGDLPNPEWAAITPRMLASHMAGVPHYGDVEDPDRFEYATMGRRYDDVRDSLALFDESPLLFAPGTDFEYSSLGTVLLGATMSAAAGERYRDIIAREVLEPAGMTATIVAPKKAPPEGRLASFYLRRGDRYREWRPVDLSHRLPGGGWASTPSDLVRMGSLWLDDDYIRAATRAEFWTPQRLADGEVNEQDYAIGWRWREWEVEGLGLARNANHGGVSRGSQSWLLVFPDYDMALAVNVNMRTDEFIEFGSAWEGVFRPFAEKIRSEGAASATE
ncbi:MAG: serine hydrolase domain-containing protein [Pseudomonadota bacterium]